jgi:general secretion pathway protein G
MSSPSHTSARSGFTFIELLVVIAIIAILSGAVALNLAGRTGEARITRAKLDIQQLQTALDTYRTDQSRYPSQQQGLMALYEKPTLEPVPARYPAEPYLRGRQIPVDPWGTPYIYLAPGRQGERYEIISYGSDGEPDGEDDAADISSSDIK